MEWYAYWRGNIEGKKKCPANIPCNPPPVYDEWISWGDWLGTGVINPQLRVFRSFIRARKFVKDLKLKNQKEWVMYCAGKLINKPPLPKLPIDIPTNPHQVYGDKGWVNYGNWIGTGTLATFNRKYRSFRSARTFARSLKLKSNKEWTEYCAKRLHKSKKLPADIPSNVSKIYIDKGWKDWKDFLGN